MILRKIIQLWMARASALVLAAVPLLALAVHLYEHRSESLSFYFTGYRGLLLIAASGVSVASLVYRATLLDFIERRFFVEPRRDGNPADQDHATRPKKRIIQIPPGARLEKVARVVFGKRAFERVFELTLLDMYDEYCEALKDGQPGQAQWVRIRGYWSFWSAVVAQLPLSLAKIAFTAWKGIR